MVQEPKDEEREFYKTRAADFLRQAAGLNSSQINAIHQQNENIRLEFKSISITNRQNVATANQLREEASQRHHKWMIQHLGKEIYKLVGSTGFEPATSTL